jgi:hypothetical protein
MADIAISNLSNQIVEAAIDDMLAVDDVSAGETKKIPFESLLGGNALINQDFSIWQENTTFTNPATDTYTADGYYIQSLAGGGTLPTINVKKNTSVCDTGFAQSMELEITNVGATGATRAYYVIQTIEDFVKYRGKSVTFSFRVKASTVITAPDTRLTLYDGVSSANASITSFTASWVTYSVTLDVSVSASLLSVYFVLCSGAGVISSTGSIYIQWMKLEIGSVSTPLVPRGNAVELLLCQRYYQKSYTQGVFPGAASASGAAIIYLEQAANADHLMVLSVKLPVVMYWTPTITLYDVAGNSGKVTMAAGNNITGTVTRENDAAISAYGTNGAANTTRHLEFQYVADIRL